MWKYHNQQIITLTAWIKIFQCAQASIDPSSGIWRFQESRSRSLLRLRTARPAWWCQRQPFTRPRPSMPKGRWRRLSSWWPTCGESPCPQAKPRPGVARCWRSRQSHPPSWTAASSEWSTPSWWGQPHCSFLALFLFLHPSTWLGVEVHRCWYCFAIFSCAYNHYSAPLSVQNQYFFGSQ